MPRRPEKVRLLLLCFSALQLASTPVYCLWEKKYENSGANDRLCMTDELHTVCACMCWLSNCKGNGRVMRCRICFDQNGAVYTLQLLSSHTFKVSASASFLFIKNKNKMPYPSYRSCQPSPLIIILCSFQCQPRQSILV